MFEDKLLEKLNFLNNFLDNKTFLIDDKVSIADLYLFSILLIIKITSINMSEYPNIEKFFKTMEAQDFVRKSIQQEIEENKRINNFNQSN